MTDPIDPLAALEAWREQGRAVLDGLRVKLRDAEAVAAAAVAERDRLAVAVAELEGRLDGKPTVPPPSRPEAPAVSLASAFVPEDDEPDAEPEEPYELLTDPMSGRQYKVYADGREIPV